MRTFIDQLLLAPATIIIVGWLWVIVFSRVVLMYEESWFGEWWFVQIFFLLWQLMTMLLYVRDYAGLVGFMLLLANVFLFFIPTFHFLSKEYFPDKKITDLFSRVVGKFFHIAIAVLVLYLVGFTLSYVYNNSPGVFGILGFIVGPVVLVIWSVVITLRSLQKEERNGDVAGKSS